MNTTYALHILTPKQLYITRALVFSLHFLLFCCIAKAGPQKTEKKPGILVHTVKLDAPKSKVAIAKTAPPQAQAAVKKTMETPIQESPKASAEPKSVSKPKAPAEHKSVSKPKTPEKPTPKPAPKPISKPLAKKSLPPTSKPVQKKKVETKPNKKPQPKVSKKQPTVDTKAKAEIEAKKQAEKRAEAKQNALIAAALHSLNRSDSIAKKKSTLSSSAQSSVTAPSHISSLASDSLVTVENEGETLTGHERTYYDELVSRLKLQLKLPELGDVKLHVTINRAGKVVRVSHVKSKSSKNRTHIETMLTKVIFSPFGQNFPNEKEHTFRLHLDNELRY